MLPRSPSNTNELPRDMEDCALYFSSHVVSATLYDAAVPEQLVLDVFFYVALIGATNGRNVKIFRHLQLLGFSPDFPGFP